MAGANSIFAGDKLLTTPNPDFNGDLDLFNKLGLVPMKAYKKGDKPEIKDSYKNRPESTEKIKWSRPSHKIERNEQAKEKGKAIRKGFKPRKVVSVKKLSTKLEINEKLTRNNVPIKKEFEPRKVVHVNKLPTKIETNEKVIENDLPIKNGFEPRKVVSVKKL